MKVKDILNIIEKDKHYQVQMNCYSTLGINNETLEEKYAEVYKEYKKWLESEIQ